MSDFNIHDRVKIIFGVWDSTGKEWTDEGDIIEYSTEADWLVAVEFPNDITELIPFMESALELFEPDTDDTAHDLDTDAPIIPPAGSRVRILALGAFGTVQRINSLDEIWVLMDGAMLPAAYAADELGVVDVPFANEGAESR